MLDRGLMDMFDLGLMDILDRGFRDMFDLGLMDILDRGFNDILVFGFFTANDWLCQPYDVDKVLKSSNSKYSPSSSSPNEKYK